MRKRERKTSKYVKAYSTRAAKAVNPAAYERILVLPCRKQRLQEKWDAMFKTKTEVNEGN